MKLFIKHYFDIIVIIRGGFMLEIILGVVVGLALITIFISILNNKFQFAIIKIEEAENNIDALLHTKKDLLERTCPIIIKELKIEEFLPEVLNINPDALNHFEFNDLLRKNYNDLLKTIDENEKLLKSDSLNSILEELKKNEGFIVPSMQSIWFGRQEKVFGTAEERQILVDYTKKAILSRDDIKYYK